MLKKLMNRSEGRERLWAIALATNFNRSLTKREDDKQFLFQMIEQHRKKLPDKRN